MKRTNQLTRAIILCLITLPVSGFGQSFGWATQFATNNSAVCFTATTDTLKNVISAGVFQGTTDFGGGCVGYLDFSTQSY